MRDLLPPRHSSPAASPDGARTRSWFYALGLRTGKAPSRAPNDTPDARDRHVPARRHPRRRRPMIAMAGTCLGWRGACRRPRREGGGNRNAPSLAAGEGRPPSRTCQGTGPATRVPSAAPSLGAAPAPWSKAACSCSLREAVDPSKPDAVGARVELCGREADLTDFQWGDDDAKVWGNTCSIAACRNEDRRSRPVPGRMAALRRPPAVQRPSCRDVRSGRPTSWPPLEQTIGTGLRVWFCDLQARHREGARLRTVRADAGRIPGPRSRTCPMTLS